MNALGVITTPGPWKNLLWWQLLYVSLATQRLGRVLQEGEEYRIEATDEERKAYSLAQPAVVVSVKKGRYKCKETE